MTYIFKSSINSLPVFFSIIDDISGLFSMLLINIELQ